MKLDLNNSSSTMSNQSPQTQTQQSTRDKSIENSQQQQQQMNSKEKLKMEKLQKEKEKREEKERKEREKKEKKEREKIMKKNATIDTSIQRQKQNISSSSTNQILQTQQQQQQQQQQMTISQSENALSRFKSTTTTATSKSINNSQLEVGGNSNSKATSNLKNQSQPIPKGKYRCHVVYLDEAVKDFELDKTAIGEDLMTLVCRDLELVEKQFFSLTYRDFNNMKFWLDHEKKIKTQLKGNINTAEPVFNFEVKFYPPEPNVLEEEITRYLITLQLRHDIMDGKLPCTFVTHALLGSFTVQAELGDYDELTTTSNSTRLINENGELIANNAGIEYLEGFCFAPNQTNELLIAIADCHKDHKGQSPAEAELHYLENAVKLAMYGVDLHNAKDSDGIDILIGVGASGLLVFRDHLRINRFAWPKILKISYKRNHFYLKLRPSQFEKYETTIGFRCPNHKAAKRLWKIAVEHHAFFRLREPESKLNNTNKSIASNIFPTFNSNLRYTGSSTYMQSRNRSIDRSQPSFTRSLSKRLTQSMDRGLAAQTQHNDSTPGSVNTAALNHFNRMKPHMSISNLQPQQNQQQYQPQQQQHPQHNSSNLNNYDLRESQEELEMEDGADYDVNDANAAAAARQLNLNPIISPRRSQQQQQIEANNNNNPSIVTSSGGGGGFRTGANLQPKNNQNFSNRSAASSSSNNANTNSANNRRIPFENVQNNQQQDFDQLDEYYTSVNDKNIDIHPTLQKSGGSRQGSNSHLNQNQRNDYPDQDDQFNNSDNNYNNNFRNNPKTATKTITPPRFRPDNNNNAPTSSNSSSNNNSYRQDQQQQQQRYYNNTSTTMDSNRSPHQASSTIRPSVGPTVVSSTASSTTSSLRYQPNENNNNNVHDFIQNTMMSTSNSQRNNQLQQQQQQQQQQQPHQASQIPVPQPSMRSSATGRQNSSSNQGPPPPPIPADRSSLKHQQQQQQQLIDEQEIERQRMLIEQREYELQQEQQLQQQKIQQLREQQQQLSRLQQQKQLRQGSSSSLAMNAAAQQQNSSRTHSQTSTPDMNNRTQKTRQLVVNEPVNHKDLLLKAIQMATDLDPNLEVEKVEITTED